jgi:hypothetical protein
MFETGQTQTCQSVTIFNQIRPKKSGDGPENQEIINMEHVIKVQCR